MFAYLCYMKNDKKNTMSTQEVKQRIADLFCTTVERVTYLYFNDVEVRCSIDMFLNDINSRRVQNGLEVVEF